MNIKKGTLFVISGPSGSGKTTLIKGLLERVCGISFGVSLTTREPRRGERDGVDYKFVSESEFKEMIRRGCFAEWACVHGYFYGTPASEIDRCLDSGQDVLLDIDVQGAELIRKRYDRGVYIFIVPPSEEVLEGRLKTRHADSDKDIQTRMSDFKREMEKKGLYDYIIVNDSLDTALERLTSVVLAERSKSPIVTGDV